MSVTRIASFVALLGLSAAAACGGEAGPAGPAGAQGPEGEKGPAGEQGTAGTGSLPDALVLPGDKFYPESITATADGTLYVGSTGSGQIVKYAPGATAPTTFVSGLVNVNGVLADDAAGLLWVCANDFFGASGASVRAFGVADGQEKKKITDAKLVACNDMALDGQKNLYVADSKGTILKLASGASTFTAWSTDTALKPATQATGFGADGIVWDTQSSLFVNNFEKGTLVRIPIKADGSADAPVAITVTGGLKTPDGMRLLSPTSLLVIDNGQLVRVDVTGTTATKTVLSNRLDQATGVVKVGKSYWVTEGQLNALFTGMAPKVPFYVQRVPTGE